MELGIEFSPLSNLLKATRGKCKTVLIMKSYKISRLLFLFKFSFTTLDYCQNLCLEGIETNTQQLRCQQ